MSQKKKFKLPKLKVNKGNKKPAQSSPQIAKKILRGPLFWIIAALIAVSVFGQISTSGEEFKKVETSLILNEISLNNVESALVIDKEQKVQVVLKDGEFVELYFEGLFKYNLPSLKFEEVFPNLDFHFAV